MEFDDDLIPTDPDCPACGTRCYPRAAGEWWCRTCKIIVLGGVDLDG